MPINVLSISDIIYLHKLLRYQPNYQLVPSANYGINRTLDNLVIVNYYNHRGLLSRSGVITPTQNLINHVRLAGGGFSRVSNKNNI